MADKIKPPNARSDQSDVWYHLKFLTVGCDAAQSLYMRGKANVEDFISRLNNPSPSRPFTLMFCRVGKIKFGIAVDLQKLLSVSFLRIGTTLPSSDATIIWIGDNNEPPEA